MLSFSVVNVDFRFDRIGPARPVRAIRHGEPGEQDANRWIGVAEVKESPAALTDHAWKRKVRDFNQARPERDGGRDGSGGGLIQPREPR